MSVDFRSDINGLRGLSVALVVAYHLQLQGAGGGLIGVDVFFVISGYLMTKIIWRELADGRFGYWRFVGARMARIWPALAAMVVLLLLAGAFLLPPFDLENLGEQAQWALVFGSNHFFNARTGYITHTADTHWLLHTWSLSVEWQFYVLYPLVVMAVAKSAATTPTRERWMVVVLAGLIAVSWAWQMFQTASDPDGSFFLLPARAWEMLAGGLVWFLERRSGRTRVAWRAVASYAGLAIVLGSALVIAYFRLRSVGLGAFLWLPVVGAALILWANHQDNLFLRNAAAQAVGRWSYSIYLWHWPILVALRMTDLSVDHPWLTVLVSIAASLVMGALSYALVERAVRGGRAPGAWRAVVKPVLLMSMAGIGTAVVAATHGLDLRTRDQHDFYRGYRASIAPLYYPDACSNFKRPPEQLQVCTIHKSGHGRILVIGDSHAEHFYAWFARHSPVPVDFFTAAECAPVPNFERTQAGYSCRDYAALAWQKAGSADYDTVIVSARWPTVGLAGGAPYCHKPSDGGRCNFLPLPNKQKLVRAELRAAIERTLQAGKTVVVVAGSPESRLRVPERLAREQFWYGQIRLRVDLRTLLERTSWIDTLFEELRSSAGFHLVSLRERLCEGTACKVYDPDLKRPIYFDESHFDPVWIAKQEDLFAPFVADRPDRKRLH